MAVETRNYNHNTGNGWRKIQTGKNKGKWALYKNHKDTGTVKANLTPVGAIKSAYNKKVKERNKLTIGEGSAENPQYTRHPRTGALKPNQNYTPPTKSNKKDTTESKSNKNVTPKSTQTPYVDPDKADKKDEEIFRSSSSGEVAKKRHAAKEKLAIEKDKNQWGKSKRYQTKDGTVVDRSNVFTKHYKTGKQLGVMTRNQRRAYDKAAAAHIRDKNKNKKNGK